jgi:hypothetical protein
MNLYVDYDDLLVSNHSSNMSNPGKGSVYVTVGREKYVCRKRPMADKMLAELSKYGSVTILSSGEREYIRLTSDALGLTLPKVIGFEDYLESVPQGWGENRIQRVQSGFDPSGVLLEHTIPFRNAMELPMMREKMAFLGIKEKQVLLMEPYNGQLEGKKAVQAWERILQDLDRMSPEI